jgi:transcriptional regulator with XRE-family HTH domain
MTSQMDTRLVKSSPSPIAERLKRPDFWLAWLRQPALDLAESVIRLRRLRGLSQKQLAEQMGTKQPAIARIESGEANVKLETLVDLAVALQTSVRLDLIPLEYVAPMEQNRWWEVSELLAQANARGFAITQFRQVPFTVGASTGTPGEAIDLLSSGEWPVTVANNNLALRA